MSKPTKDEKNESKTADQEKLTQIKPVFDQESTLKKRLSSTEEISAIKGELINMMNKLDHMENAKSSEKIQFDKMINNLEKKLKDDISEFTGNVETLIENLEKKLENVFSEAQASTPKALPSPKTEHRNPQEKEFAIKDSLMTIMFNKGNDFKTLYNMCASLLFVLFFALLFHEYTTKGRWFDFETWEYAFNGYPNAGYNWLFLFGFSQLIILQVILYKKFPQLSMLWIILYAIQQLMLVSIGFYFVSRKDYGIAVRLTIIAECTRFAMKSHSYWRNKLLYGLPKNKQIQSIPKFLEERSGVDKNIKILDINILAIPEEIQRFTYFSFAPTLIYRDYYPQRKSISWEFAISNFLNVLLCIYFDYILQKFFLKEDTLFVGKSAEFSFQFLLNLFKIMPPLCFFFLLNFFLILHCWFNLFGEILKFPDRHFYDDWWNCTDFASFFRKWNLVVSEWLYYQVYIDVPRFFNKNLKKEQCFILTIIISAYVHEIIVTGGLGYFQPIMFLEFAGLGVFLALTKFGKTGSNLMFWICQMNGLGLMIFMYSHEYYIRQLYKDQLEKKFGFALYYLPAQILKQFI